VRGCRVVLRIVVVEACAELGSEVEDDVEVAYVCVVLDKVVEVWVLKVAD
jgi:hypothetical protein